ncbi:hypothetical protein H9L13_02985 [Sphingomonas lutea]|uniref:Tetratricopeptide repeat protein n=1 Tax=Sphingomonas lutea TaxID=1045317 RepID=A0A7G9SJ77_9SPHN|nr:hypothetical protein [Sphingomonas lutea]QNN67902.1 hypothetical protein H9L13_02985 [Sphingomonas lutea]
MQADLRRHIGQARAIDPKMAEASIAEAALLPVRDFHARGQAISAAAAQKPDDPIILDILASNLAASGYLRDAVETASRAVTLDPLSPKIRSTYITLLTYAGSFDAAKRELRKAEKLWPGTASVADAQFRFHYRYGDPKIARPLFEDRANVGGRGPRLIMATREDPSPIRVQELLNFVRERLRNMENPSAGIGFAILAFGQFGQPEDVISTLLSWPKTEDVAVISEVLFRPEFTATRRDKRFMMIAKRAGLLELWQKSNEWPDFCSEPGQTYDCRAEAAKLG